VPNDNPATEAPHEKKFKADVTEHTLSVTSVREKRRIILVFLFFITCCFLAWIAYGVIASSMAPVASYTGTVMTFLSGLIASSMAPVAS
jgi:Co/Zn/Cd efflux system component